MDVVSLAFGVELIVCWFVGAASFWVGGCCFEGCGSVGSFFVGAGSVADGVCGCWREGGVRFDPCFLRNGGCSDGGVC